MKGLLWKDFYLLTGLYKRNFVMIAFLYAAIYLTTGANLFLFMMIAIMGFYCLSTVALDDACCWNRYARTLPLRSEHMIGGKFLICLFSILAGTVYAVILGLFRTLLHGGNMMSIIMTASITALVTLAMMAFLLPTALKWGVEKARNSFLVLFALGFFGIGLLKEAIATHLGPMVSRLSFHPASLLIGIGGICSALYLLGFFISDHIYQNKEF